MPSGGYIEEKKHLEIIQILRLVAALAVVGVHLPTVPGGYWGVDLFFVISGFVIALSSNRNADQFLIKRIFRVVPIYWILTFGVFFVAIIAPTLLNNTSSDPVHLLKSLFFIPFDKNGNGHKPVLFVGWTLNFEMLFYVILAAALFITRKFSIALAALLILAVHIVALRFGDDYPLLAYRNAQMFEFAIGMLVWLIYARPPDWRINAAIVTTVVVIGLSGAGSAPQTEVLAPAILSGLAVLAGALFLAHMRFPAVLVLLGDASYSLYLSHAYIVQAAVKSGLLGGGIAQMALMTVIVVALCLFVSAVLWLKVEKPLNDYLRSRLARPRPRVAEAAVGN